jgi:adenylosuccinate synthase
MLVNPLSLANEAEALSHFITDPYSLLTVEREALITNPFQIATNRIKEIQRGANRHGSCGMGIGETVEDSLNFPDMAIRVKDLQDPEILRKKLCFSREFKLAQLGSSSSPILPDEVFQDSPMNAWIFLDKEAIEYCVYRFTEIAKKLNIVDDSYLGTLLKQNGTVLFEGAQGVLLDQDYGFYPYTTWTDTTFGNADKLLQQAGYTGPVKRLGILRGYMTRHGAGPLPTEITEPEIAPDVHNVYGKFQRHFRLGYFDAVLAKYALQVIGGVDEIALTNLDKLGACPKICTHYKKDYKYYTALPVQSQPVDLNRQQELMQLLSEIQPQYQQPISRKEYVLAIAEALNTPISLCSYGPIYRHKLPFQDYLRIIDDKYAMPANSAFVLGL